MELNIIQQISEDQTPNDFAPVFVERQAKELRVEPYFTLINNATDFRVVCTSKGSDGKELRNDVLVIQKKNAICKQKGK